MDGNLPGGVNPSERFLATLCRRSFLSLWSYPNPYRDQRAHPGGVGKELCDLLAIFGNTVLLFSDKRCVFPDVEPLHLAWSRWYRRTISSSVSQVTGADRWVRTNPERTFLDPQCTVPLPFPLPRVPHIRTHLICVAGGAVEACRTHLSDPRGSLMLYPDDRPPLYRIDGESEGTPFCIGVPMSAHGIVHVFDEAGIEIVLRTLDTMPDFIAYLDARQDLLRSGKLFSAAGEEDLLAYYISHRYLGPENAFSFDTDGPGMLAVLPGHWDTLVQDPQYHAKIEADTVSYLWDMIIEDFTKHLRSSTLHGTIVDVLGVERVLRSLAESTRFERRNLSQSLLHVAAQSANSRRPFTRTILPDGRGRLGYVLMAMPKLESEAAPSYRERRKAFLRTYLEVVGMHNRQCEELLGLATESADSSARSHDIMRLDNREWPPEREHEVAEIQKKTSFFTRTSTQTTRPLEFPHVHEFGGSIGKMSMLDNRAWERPCPCGSDRSYRECCGQSHTNED